MIQIWPNQKRERKNIFPSFLIWREIGNKKNQGLENVEYECGFLEPFLGEKKSSEFPQSAFFSSSQVCFSSLLRNSISIILVHPFILSLLFIWFEMLRTQEAESILMRKDEKDLSFVCYCRLPSPELGGSHTAFDREPWTVRAGRNLRVTWLTPSFHR